MISVVIPARNAAATIGCQIDALAAQRFEGDWEIVVADNGSTDDTRSVAEGRALDLPWLRVVDASQRPGPAAARNIGASSARGRVLLFTDADDMVVPDWLSTHASVLESAHFSTGPVFPIDREAATVEPRAGRVARPLVHMRFLPYALGANFGVTREAFEAAGGFREDRRTGEDVDLSWRLQERGSVLVFAPEAQVGHRSASGAGRILRQYFEYGRTDPFLYRDHRSAGVPPERAGEVLKSYLGLVLRLFFLWDEAQRAHWLHQAGRRAGRVAGSFEARTVYL